MGCRLWGHTESDTTEVTSQLSSSNRRKGGWETGEEELDPAGRADQSPVLTYLPYSSSSSFFGPIARILVYHPRMEPVTPEVEGQSLNRWTTGEFPAMFFF